MLPLIQAVPPSHTYPPDGWGGATGAAVLVGSTTTGAIVAVGAGGLVGAFVGALVGVFVGGFVGSFVPVGVAVFVGRRVAVAVLVAVSLGSGV